MATATFRGEWERYAPDYQSSYPGLAFFRSVEDGTDLNSRRDDWLTTEAVTVSASLVGGFYLIRSVSTGGMCAFPLPDAPYLLTIEGWPDAIELLVRHKVDATTFDVVEV